MVASPFHSRRVQEEVDSDARALGHVAAADPSALEVEYGRQLAARDVRVARVEAQAEQVTRRSPPLHGSGMPRAIRPLEDEGVTLALVPTETKAEAVKEESRALALVGRTEMISVSRGTFVLMMEENRNLRWRLEQVETQSSWHSSYTRNTSHGLISFCQGPPGWVGVQRALPYGLKRGIMTLRALSPQPGFRQGHISACGSPPPKLMGIGQRATWDPMLFMGSHGYGTPADEA